MNKLITIITFVLGMMFSGVGISQIVIFTSQAEVDAFDQSVTTINGSLYISGTTSLPTDITDLSNLSNLTSIDGEVIITNNNQLTNIDGLSNISSVGSLFITSNKALPNLDGLSNLISVGDQMVIIDNDKLANIDSLSKLTILNNVSIIENKSLTNIDGLINLTSVGEAVGIIQNRALVNLDGLSNLSSVDGVVAITGNVKLTNVNGLSNISNIGEWLQIVGNDSLRHLDGLYNLNYIGGDLEVSGNLSLTDCCGIQNLLSTPGAIGGDIIMFDNPFDCSSQEAILEFDCVFNELKGVLLYDINNDGCSSGNYPIPKIKVSTSGGTYARSTFSRSTGAYILNLEQGEYSVSINPIDLPSHFSATPSSFEVDFLGGDSIVTQDICIESTQIVSDLYVTLLPVSLGRPGFVSIYRMTYTNIGTTSMSGEVSLNFDNTKMEYVESDPSPISVTDSTLVFDYEDLLPFETGVVDLNFKIFTPPTVLNGDELCFTTTITPVENDITPEDNTHDFCQIVVGSYDPNDITVLEGERIFISDIDRYLHYVIRFQNTGTASAIGIRVHNVLDDKLDWSTFKIESTSHMSYMEIENGNQLDFIFEDINLPDSTSSEMDSHGFIAYKIKPRQDLSTGDIIRNKADIYFDFNPPIETNTVTTEVVKPLAITDINTALFSAYPVPSTGMVQISSTKDIAHIEVYSPDGRLVKRVHRESKVDMSGLQSAIYYGIVTDIDGASGVVKLVKN